MKVSITVDVEFCINGAFSDSKSLPMGKQRVLCPKNGVNTGLPFILETLQKYGARGTFFIEAMQRAYFEKTEMGDFIPPILKGGHEIGLHIHPCWLAFRNQNWRDHAKRNPPKDDCGLLTEEDADAAIRYGMENLAEIGATNIQSVRTGSLRCSKTFYKACAKNNLFIASNLGIGYVRPQEKDLWIYGGHKTVHGVTELPILTYNSFDLPGLKREKILTITGTSFAVTRQLLYQAHAHNFSHVIILTHPFEFESKHNQERLNELCKYIKLNSYKFSFATLYECHQAIANKPNFTPPPLTAEITTSAFNILTNKFLV